MKITKDTVCCISIAESPGNFGSLLFNQTFKALSLDFIYKPFRVTSTDLPHAIKGIRALNIRGCGVSMPHKTIVHKYLDAVDPLAKEIGAINTIVNRNGILTGYNTDVIGAAKALEDRYPISGKSAHIIGSGGAARAIIIALQKSSCQKISLSSRDEKRAQKIAREFDVAYCQNKKRGQIKADLLVNATPVGMTPNEEIMIVDERELGLIRRFPILEYRKQRRLVLQRLQRSVDLHEDPLF